MKVKTKVRPSAYHLEFISIPELALEIKISKHALIRYMQRDGFLTRNNAPTVSMIDTGNMFMDENEDGENHPMVTSKGYFFFMKHFKKHLKRHQKRELLILKPRQGRNLKQNTLKLKKAFVLFGT